MSPGYAFGPSLRPGARAQPIDRLVEDGAQERLVFLVTTLGDDDLVEPEPGALGDPAPGQVVGQRADLEPEPTQDVERIAAHEDDGPGGEPVPAKGARTR